MDFVDHPSEIRMTHRNEVENMTLPGYYLLDRRDFSEADYDRFRQICPLERQKRADRFRKLEDRQLCLLGGAVTVLALSHRLSLPYDCLTIRTEAGGKPYLEGHNLFFNLSHSRDKLLLALSQHPIGCDIEALRTPGGALLRGVCSESELRYIGTPPSEERFTAVWCRKEAFLKESGKGILQNLKNLDTCTEDGLLTKIGDLAFFSGFDGRYAFCLCGRGATSAIRLDATALF